MNRDRIFAAEGNRRSLLRVDLADPSKRKALYSMIKDMLGIAEGILQDLYDDHEEVASLLEAIADSEDGWE